MNDESKQPKEYDLVLGGNNPPPTDGLVLGGIAGVKQRLASEDIEVRIAALQDAIKYEDEGLDLIIKALEDNSNLVKKSAYLYLKNIDKQKVNNILNSYSLFSWFTPLFTIETRERLDGNSISVSKFAISPDNSNLITYGKNNTTEYLKIWNLQTGKLVNNYNFPRYNTNYESSINGIIVSPDGNKCYIICSIIRLGENGYIREIDLNTGKILRTLTRSNGAAICLSISPDNQILVIGDVSKNKDVEVWNLSTGTSYYLGDKSRSVKFVDISSDSKIAISHSLNAIKVWNLETKKLLHILEGIKKIGCPSQNICVGGKLSPDLKSVVGFSENTVQEWNLKTGELINTRKFNIIRAEYFSSSPNDFIFCSDWKTAIGVEHFDAPEPALIKIFNWQTGEIFNTLKADNHYALKCIALSQDEQTLVSGGRGGKIQVWGIR